MIFQRESTEPGRRRLVTPARHLEFDPLQSRILKDGYKRQPLSNEGKAAQALELYKKHVYEGQKWEEHPRRAVYDYQKAQQVLAWALGLGGIGQKLRGKMEHKLEAITVKVFRLHANEARMLAKNAAGEEFEIELSMLKEASKASDCALNALALAILYFGNGTPAYKRLHPQFEKFRLDFALKLSQKIERMKKADEDLHPERKLVGG